MLLIIADARSGGPAQKGAGREAHRAPGAVGGSERSRKGATEGAGCCRWL